MFNRLRKEQNMKDMKDVTIEDLKFYSISSTISVTLLIIGGALESTLLPLIGVGLIFVVPIVRATSKKHE